MMKMSMEIRHCMRVFDHRRIPNINFISKMQNLTISNFFGAPEFCFDAKFGVAIFCWHCDPPCKGKSPSLQKIATPNFASKQNSGAPKKFEIVKFCIFALKFCFFLGTLLSGLTLNMAMCKTGLLALLVQATCGIKISSDNVRPFQMFFKIF